MFIVKVKVLLGRYELRKELARLQAEVKGNEKVPNQVFAGLERTASHFSLQRAKDKDERTF